jgi:Colicin V production protein
MLILVMITIFLIVAVNSWWAGFWSNLILLVNMLIGAMAATAFFINLATVIAKGEPTWKLLAPFLSLWILFFVVTAIARGATDTLSRIKLKFDIWTEMTGRTVMSMLVGLLFISFVSFTLKFAPIPPFFFNNQQTAAIGPEIVWEKAAQYWSNLTMSESMRYCLLDPAEEVEVDLDDASVQLNHRPINTNLDGISDSIRSSFESREVLRVLPER